MGVTGCGTELIPKMQRHSNCKLIFKRAVYGGGLPTVWFLNVLEVLWSKLFIFRV